MFTIVSLATILALGCQPQERVLQDIEKEAMIDSLIGLKMEEINRQAMEDLDRRKSIEVKAKADSIVASIKDSMIRESRVPDNTIPNNLPMP